MQGGLQQSTWDIVMASSLPEFPTTPNTPFDLPAELLKKILEEYYRHETLVISKPRNWPTNYYYLGCHDHFPVPLTKYKHYFTRTRCSILNLTSTSRSLRHLALGHLAKYVYIDLKGREETDWFLAVFERSFRQSIEHVVTRAHNTDIWATKSFQRRWPALNTLTVYEDWSNDGVGRDKFTLNLEHARFWDVEKRAWQYTKQADAVVASVKKPRNENFVFDSRLRDYQEDALTLEMVLIMHVASRL